MCFVFKDIAIDSEKEDMNRMLKRKTILLRLCYSADKRVHKPIVLALMELMSSPPLPSGCV